MAEVQDGDPFEDQPEADKPMSDASLIQHEDSSKTAKDSKASSAHSEDVNLNTDHDSVEDSHQEALDKVSLSDEGAEISSTYCEGKANNSANDIHSDKPENFNTQTPEVDEQHLNANGDSRLTGMGDGEDSGKVIKNPDTNKNHPEGQQSDPEDQVSDPEDARLLSDNSQTAKTQSVVQNSEQDSIEIEVNDSRTEVDLDVVAEIDLVTSYDPECDQQTSDNTNGIHLDIPSPSKSNSLEQVSHDGVKERSETLGLIQEGIQTAINESSALFIESDPPSSVSDSGLASPCNIQYSSASQSPAHLQQSPPAHTTNHLCSESDMQLNSTTNASSVESTHIPNSSMKDVDLSDSSEQLNNVQVAPRDSSLNVADETEDQLLSELETELEVDSTPVSTTSVSNDKKLVPNGLVIEGVDIPQLQELHSKYTDLQTKYEQQQHSITRLKAEKEQLTGQVTHAMQERDSYRNQLHNSQTTSENDIYRTQINELECTIVKVQKEAQSYLGKLAAHDAAAKRAVSTLQNELKLRVDQVTKMYDECRKEKDGMVVKYAQAEQKNIELQDRMEKNDTRVKDVMKEREVMITKFRSMKTDKHKAEETVESRNVELMSMKRELEKHREMVSSLDVKMKWAQNKLKAEMDAHKETRTKLDEEQRKMKEAREEAEQIRRDCQSMIKTYQESEEHKTGSLDKQLKEREIQLKRQKHDTIDQAEVHHLVKRELETLKMKHKEMLSEVKTWRDKAKCLEAERIMQEEILNKFKETLQNQKTDNKNMFEKVTALENVEQDLNKERELVASLQEQVGDLEQRNTELEDDMEGCAKRETEHLKLTQKLTDNNAKLLSENNGLNSKVTGLTAEVERLQSVVKDLEKKLSAMEFSLSEEKQLRESERNLLTVKLGEKSRAVEELTRLVEDGKDEVKTLKRKHVANVKDLTRQLQQIKKKMEVHEKSGDTPSMGSRTSSSNSLDTVGNNNGHHAQFSSHGASVCTEPSSPQEEYQPVVKVVEVDKQMLVEKIVRLQKAHARKNEKLEFLEDHIHHLVEDIQKKTRIIQNYALREEIGVLAPEESDINKIQIAKKGGIMASLYSAHQQDGSMTMELLLDINRKLQAVLEDTLLKNITLKENLDTLGQEIARLSQENRKIQLQFNKEQES